MIILCVIAALLAVIVLIPVQIRAAYDQGDISAFVRYGPLKIALYPRPEKEDAGEEKPKKEKKSTKSEKRKETQPAASAEKAETGEAAPAEEPEKKKKKLKINKDQILYSLEKLPPILGRALKRTGKRIRIVPLKIHLLVAGTDPADTALLYGKLEAALAAGLPTLHQLVRIREQDIQLFLDFQEEQMDCIADVGLTIRPWDVLVIALCAGASALKWFIEFRKLADKPAAAENTNEKPAPADGAGAA